MAKIRTIYSCRECGHSSSKWLGRCPTCEAWNSFDEETQTADTAASVLPTVSKGVVSLDSKTDEDTERSLFRFSTGIGELDRVLGGGIIPDSFVLLGGEPGIGKSTLLLQATQGLVAKNPEVKVLYVSGEESIDQIRGRARRLGVTGGERIFLAAETLLEQVFATVKELKPQVLVIDSVQTFSTGQVDAAPGSVSQVREVTARLMHLAKSTRINIWLVGHVTKEGAIAGPKVVEHMVDTVLYFEAESGQSYRLLRAVKNRFGSSRELGIFEMDSEGLVEVPNPSALFLSERTEAVSGTAVSASIEGSRPILVELQALVSTSGLAVPRRTSVGLEGARLSLLAAILEKHLGLKLANQDLFFNVAGGLKLSEPACDLGAAAAIWSSSEGIPIPHDRVFLGELGLTGEVRRVSNPEVRLEEALKLGFKSAVVPTSSLSRLEKFKPRLKGLEIRAISSIRELGAVLTSSRQEALSSDGSRRRPISAPPAPRA